MKRLISFMIGIFLVAFTGEVFAQYTVQIRFSQVRPSSNQTEWKLDLFADVFDSNNNLVPEYITDQYLFEWYRDKCDGGGYTLYQWWTGLSELGELDGMWDKTPQSPDCCGEPCHFESYMIYARVLIDGQWYTSGEVRAPDNGLNNIFPRDTIVVDQKRSNSATDGYIGRGYTQGIFNYPAPDTFYNRAGQHEVFRASQDLFTSPNEKYNRWQNVNDVVNHRPFTITSSQPDLVGQLGLAYAATVQTDFITLGEANAGYVEFKDPWLVIEGDPKYYDSPYGYRNLGMAGADLEPYSQLPLQLLTASIFKGVFLDQGFPFYDPPYYSVAAPNQSINGVTYFLDRWTATGHSFRMPPPEPPQLFSASPTPPSPPT